MTALELPNGYATVEGAPKVSTSDWRQGMSHRRDRSWQLPRTWRVRWDGRGIEAREYLEALFLEAGQGAGVLTWTPPNNDDEEVHVRFTELEVDMRTPSNCTLQATLVEALEPCG